MIRKLLRLSKQEDVLLGTCYVFVESESMSWESQVVIFDSKSIIDLNQFEGTIWAKHYTGNKLVKIMTLV